jgi:hypothetical protein
VKSEKRNEKSKDVNRRLFLRALVFALCGTLFGEDLQNDFPGQDGETLVTVKNYVLKGNVLVGYRGGENELIIPEDLGITEIGDGAFSTSRITSITVPNGVQKIGRSFDDCHFLTAVGLPSTLQSIGDDAFAFCRSLVNITIPENVTFIGERVFYVCRSLEVIDVHGQNPAYTGIEGVLYDKAGTTIVQYPEGKKGDSYIIGEGVTSIGERAFLRSGLESISVPASVTSIGDEAFNSCGNLREIKVNGRNTAYSDIGGILFDKDKTTLIRCPQEYDGSTYKVPSSVITISKDAFRGCNLTGITLPASVTFIGSWAFSFNRTLTGITIPEGVTSIEENTFYECTSLTGIKLPKSVTTIGENAFRVCSSLALIKIPEGVTSIGKSAFFICESLAVITIPESVTNIGDWAFYRCVNLPSITIPKGVTTIGDYAFRDCFSLKTVKLSRHTRIGSDAFPLNIELIYR